MKLWKIMLAVIVAVLMISCVAMAETHNHTWSAGVPQQTSGIYTKGDEVHYATFQDVYHCECGATNYSQPYEATIGACDFKDGATVSATCSAKAYTEKICKVCGYSKKVEFGEKRQHAQIILKAHAATCMNAPYIDWGCSMCDATWTTGDPNDAAGRSACVYEEKKIDDGNCKNKPTYAKKCKYCGAYEGGRTYQKETDTVGAHKWVETKIPATCTEQGAKIKDCSLCGKHEDEPIAKLGHHIDYSTEVITKATCTADGYKTAKCHVCGESFIYDKGVGDLAKGHKVVTVDYKAAKCNMPGNLQYKVCTVCGSMWDMDNDPISSVPVIPANDKHVFGQTNVNYHYTDCSSATNYREGTCEYCGKWFVEYLPASEHNFPKATNAHATPATVATCTKDGKGVVTCTKCGETKEAVIPALGHDWYDWAYGEAATCIKDMVASRTCKRDSSHTEWKTVVPALGHTWVEVKGTEPTCTTPGKVDRECAVCKIKEYGKVLAALGHNFTKVVETVKPTCEAQGYTVYTCSRGCADTKKADFTAALGHSYSWVVVTKPSEAGNGKNEYTCATCKKVADTKTVKYTKYYYNNTITSFGPTTKELVGGNDWYRVTPVDLSIDGVYTYDLIASNKYVVGKVTIAVNAGTLTVSYKANGVDVKDEALLIYASKADLATGTAVTAPVGAAINAAETFGADTKVLVSLILTGDYDAAGKGLVDASAAAGMIANID